MPCLSPDLSQTHWKLLWQPSHCHSIHGIWVFSRGIQLSPPSCDQLLTRIRKNLRRCLMFAALACAVRPTNAIIWSFLIPVVAWRLRSRKNLLLEMGIDVFWVGWVSKPSLLDTNSWSHFAGYWRSHYCSLWIQCITVHPPSLLPTFFAQIFRLSLCSMA